MNMGDSRHEPDLFQLLTQHRGEILDAYQQDLETADSKIASDEAAMRQARANAELILLSVAQGVGGGVPELDEEATALAWSIGFARAASGVHSVESLRAASLFFQSVINVIGRHLPPGNRSIGMFCELVLALERSIAARIRESATAYTGFLLNQVHDAQLRERRRIARELHDRIGHSVAAAHRQLELYDQFRATDPVKASTKVETALEAIQETMRQLRAMTSELHPNDRVRSLEKALAGYLNAVDVDDVETVLEINGDESWAPPLVLDETFLIIREAARNAFNHGAPSVVHIRVNVAPHELHASVNDNGRGFTDADLGAADGVGLSSMRERAELLGGTVTVTSAPGTGTRMDLSVPLRA